MTAETSNARGDVVAERQAWYEQQIALAEGQWAAAFLDRWECGDDVPSKEHYVALWLAERAAPQPADARGDADVWLFKGTDDAWHTFHNEQHRLDTIADGRWEVRKFTALSQQPEARGVVDGGSRIVTSQLLHWSGIPVRVTGTVTTSPGNWPLIDAALTEARDDR